MAPRGYETEPAQTRSQTRAREDNNNRPNDNRRNDNRRNDDRRNDDRRHDNRRNDNRHNDNRRNDNQAPAAPVGADPDQHRNYLQEFYPVEDYPEFPENPIWAPGPGNQPRDLDHPDSRIAYWSNPAIPPPPEVGQRARAGAAARAAETRRNAHTAAARAENEARHDWESHKETLWKANRSYEEWEPESSALWVAKERLSDAEIRARSAVQSDAMRGRRR